MGTTTLETLPGFIQEGNSIRYKDYEWYATLEDSELKDEALNNKAILEESMNVEGESSDDAWSYYSPIDEWKDSEHSTYIETDASSNQNTYNNIFQIVMDHNKTQGKHGWFDEHELMGDDDDDIGDLEDYLIRKDPPYYVNEKEERSKERRCKLLRIPYVKPPTCKSEKFEVVNTRSDQRRNMSQSRNMNMKFGSESINVCLKSTKIFSERRTKDGTRYGVSKLHGYDVLTPPGRLNTAYPEIWIRRIDFRNLTGRLNEFGDAYFLEFMCVVVMLVLKYATYHSTGSKNTNRALARCRDSSSNLQFIYLQMDDPNITMEEYIRLEEEKARRRGKVSVETEFPAIAFNDEVSSEKTLSCEPMVSSLNDEIDFKISFDDSDDEDYTVIFYKNSFSYKIISTNDLKTDSENDNEKVNMPSLPSPEPTVSCFDDLDLFKDFENEFPAVVYNDASTSKSDLLTEPILSP
ncbi:hypothetical protein Tco_1227715 [Tanacetum coccineum]